MPSALGIYWEINQREALICFFSFPDLPKWLPALRTRDSGLQVRRGWQLTRGEVNLNSAEWHEGLLLGLGIRHTGILPHQVKLFRSGATPLSRHGPGRRTIAFIGSLTYIVQR